ncbi:DNA ligase [Marinobacterium jannaschii]|uniref:DNA ligase n=1 Tax=Marinobacterium jannaschii TaxID=64970 RepID=UPI0004842EBE|nr:DNA ligase [Marinobacterium jannaschii]
MKLVYLVLILFISLPLPLWVSAANLSPPAVMLAKTYSPVSDITRYLVSEKLDGVRAYWDGKLLRSRSGRVIQAPDWFLAGLPEVPLDGELWAGRGNFETVSAASRRRNSERDWWDIRFMVFDMPAAEGDFSSRYQALTGLVERLDQPHLALVQHQQLASPEALDQLLYAVTNHGGEGLMLRRADSAYQGGRSSDMLKLKLFEDAEAVVIAHLPGKGRHQGRLGALLVRLPDGKKLKLGSGLSDPERITPPPLGTTVTYRFNGYTSKGLPRFARYLRIRND